MRSHTEKPNAKLCLAPDALHNCKFCHACGGDYATVGRCDNFHDKEIAPTTKRVCQNWELHVMRVDEVPAGFDADLLRETSVETQFREIATLSGDLNRMLWHTFQVVQKLPPSMKTGMPEIAWMEKFIDTLSASRYYAYISFFEKLSCKLDGQEHDWTLPEAK